MKSKPTKIRTTEKERKRDRAEAYAQGWEDHRHGVKLERCPFPNDPPLRNAWARGWLLAERGLAVDIPRQRRGLATWPEPRP